MGQQGSCFRGKFQEQGRVNGDEVDRRGVWHAPKLSERERAQHTRGGSCRGHVRTGKEGAGRMTWEAGKQYHQEPPSPPPSTRSQRPGHACARADAPLSTIHSTPHLPSRLPSTDKQTHLILIHHPARPPFIPPLTTLLLLDDIIYPQMREARVPRHQLRQGGFPDSRGAGDDDVGVGP